MNRRSFLLLGAATSLLVASTDGAPAQGLPLSTLTVKVLSVDRESLDRHTYRRESFQTGESSGGWSEKTGFVAKAQIEAVLDNNHGLMSGAVIDIRYIAVKSTVPAEVRDRALKAGETMTLTVFRNQTGFWWRQPP
jgi:hypothetical protein